MFGRSVPGVHPELRLVIPYGGYVGVVVGLGGSVVILCAQAGRCRLSAMVPIVGRCVVVVAL